MLSVYQGCHIDGSRSTLCHPLEGGDPEYKGEFFFKIWIPAYAGMTVEKIDRNSYFT